MCRPHHYPFMMMWTRWLLATLPCVSCVATSDASLDAETGSRPQADAMGSPSLPSCEAPGRLVVTDIDATLTFSDNEFLTQLATGKEPAARTGGAKLIAGYHERGYSIVYLTSRPEALRVFGGESVPQATRRWLLENGFPVDQESTHLQLSPALVFGASSATYKGEALNDLVAEGFSLDFAYGNASSDIDAYEVAGIDKNVTFIIGPEAGTKDTVAISGDSWLDHAALQLASVEPACRW